jgi:hypothetical protein
MGADAEREYPDEIQLAAGDGYNETYQKNNGIVRDFLRTDYTHLIMGDVDTYFCIERLLLCGFDTHDYTGRRCAEGHAGGGNGYCLSRRAVEILRDHPLIGCSYNDLELGTILRDHGVHVWDRSDIFLSHIPTSWPVNAVSAHLGTGTGTWDPQRLIDFHSLALTPH